MKTIDVPPAIGLYNIDGKPVVTQTGVHKYINFREFLEGTLLADPKFGKTLPDLLSACEIKKKLRELMPIESEAPEASAVDKPLKLVLETADYDKLLSIVKEPTYPYEPTIVMQLSSFLVAIRDAV